MARRKEGTEPGSTGSFKAPFSLRRSDAGRDTMCASVTCHQCYDTAFPSFIFWFFRTLRLAAHGGNMAQHRKGAAPHPEPRGQARELLTS